MRVAIISYPILFQSSGGLKMKINRTIEALTKIGIEARLIDPVRERFTEYDLIHVFACHQGNFRIVQQAKGDGVPVVMSTILNPPFSKWDGLKAEFLSRLVGKLTHWELTTNYQQIQIGLNLADHLIALGSVEVQMLVDGYNISPKKISIIENGIGAEFFNTGPDAFYEMYSIPHPFVLHTGLIGDTKNQLGLIHALRNEPINIVLIGYSNQLSQAYLDECLRAGGGRVYYLGEMSHGALLASAYAAADLIAIPSRHEGMPNSVLEALASDKPVVMTKHHTMNLDLTNQAVLQVDSHDETAICSAVLSLLKSPPPKGISRAIVSTLAWPVVAEKLAELYCQVIKTARN
jgi:glycosyltransferase involved in cell wall biosynthesis